MRTVQLRTVRLHTICFDMLEAFGPPPATTPSVGDALRRVQSQWIYLYAVSWKARSTLPTGGVVAGGGAEAPLAPPARARARARVCVYTYICDIF